MHTTDNQGTPSPALRARIARDMRVVWRLLGMVASYLLVGSWIRRRVRMMAARGEVYHVDRHHPRSR